MPTVKQCPYGHGVFSSKFVHKGDMVWKLQGVAAANRTRTTIQIGHDRHVNDPLGIYLNHSFEPNCRIDGRRVIALRDIAAGEHLTFDYTCNEDSIAAPFLAEGRMVS